jgi:hypothetical protein
MVYINGTEFKIYSLDTTTSILNRIASNLNTLPSFLYFPNGIPPLEEFQIQDNIVVENLFDTIKNSLDFNQLFTDIKEKVDQQKIDINEVIKIFIIYNKNIEEIEYSDDDDYKRLYLDHLIGELRKSFKDTVNKDINITEIVKNKISSQKEYLKLINNNREKTALKETELTKFDKHTGIPYTEFELEKINFEMDLKILDLTLLEIFNKIMLSDYIPFCSCYNFYKLRKEFVPPLQWSMQYENIVLKVLQKEKPKYEITDYTDVIIDIKDGKTTAILEYDIINNIPKEQLIERFVSVINIKNINIENIKEKSINGVLYFPNQRMNRYVMTDLIMNDDEFSSLMSIDETVIAQKPSIYIRFYTEDTGNIKVFFTEKIVNKKDPTIKDKPDFIENSYYVRVKINEATSLSDIQKFQDIFSKLFIVYNSRYQDIIDFYSLYMTVDDLEKNIEVGTVPIKKTKKKNTLVDTAPELYPSNYTKFCGQPPVMINEEDEAGEIEKGRSVLTFPKDISEGSIPRKYICEYKKYPYPGLRENTLSNSDKFKYLPCCLETPQTEKPSYRNYYYGEEIPETITDQHIITTDRFLNNKQNGYLPQNIIKFFDSIESNKDYDYYRQGVLKTKNTFLNCILTALDLLKEDTENFIESIRKELATYNLASSCKQEMYDYKVQDIINKINNSNEYFNPDFFIHLLESKYNCNIILFKRNLENPYGSIVVPRHVKGYFKTQKIFNKCIFIYEHNGIESDNAKYPQCELIFRWNKKGQKDDLQYSFDYKDYVTQNAIEIFNEYNKFYILNNEITTIYFTEKINIVSQVIDFYGKTRMINIDFEGNIITIFTSPLQPFNVPEESSYKVYKINNELVNKFSVNVSLYDKKIHNNILTGIIGNVKISIPLVDSSIVSFNEHISYINNYNTYKKLSRYIVQYFYWLYSRYLKENNIKDDYSNKDNFETFKSKYIEINENFKYGNIPIQFSLNNDIMSGGKLVLKSEETFDRLSYLLSIELIRNVNKIIMFSDRQIIENYYTEVSDFDSYQFQIVLKGQDSIQKFIESSLQDDIQYKLYDKILKESLSPYFFKNKNIDDSVYLAQNTISIKKAIQIYLTWINNKYNPLYNPKDTEEDYGFIFYSYKNNNTIKPYYIQGKEYSKFIRIIGFKIFKDEEDDIGHSYYTILLPL